MQFDLNHLFLLAQAADGAAPTSGNPLSLLTSSPFAMVGVMFIIMYFLVIRPQRSEEKKRKAMIENLQKGDQVVTSSGIHGKIVEFKENNETVVIAIAKDTNVTFNTSTILKKKEG
ncbi:preprotein translocase subunit YajC [Leptospira perolatii]|uniref:Sec translocon accessory complex subunit YajC n=1 Tax=Leptospira perolatii TaxID=2023191 RepID=A0A2M9ZLC8_9LEPT|nr:preprotein translocase subunit YajC [Leptospira perolatii]PJZ70363.1 preprotein translocase subunit YajC [Leptospira perolatii]PJZ72753.1 preprotein translocase subunit YajC [Leptospira perolatii]